MSNQKEPTKHRHHYVPVGLSSRFCIQPKKLYLYDLQEKLVYPSDPKNAFVAKHYHSVEDDQGDYDHNEIEDMLVEHEGKGLQAIRKYIGIGTLEWEERQDLAGFMALQHVRTPHNRIGAEAFLKEIVKNTSGMLEKAGKLSPAPEILKPFGNTFHELTEKGYISINLLPQVTLMPMIAVGRY